MKEGEVFPQKNYISNSVEETVRTVLPKYIGYSVEDILEWVKSEEAISKRLEWGAVWRNVYRRDFLNKNQIRFNPSIRLNEDSMFNAMCFSRAQKIRTLNKGFYCYTIRPSGAFMKKRDAELVENKTALLKARSNIVNDLNKRGFDFSVKDYEYIGYAALREGGKKYSAVITGSDQLWSPAGLPTNYYNLMFVPDDTLKISIASSFGVKEIPWYQKKRTIQYLNRIEYISMRENRGSEIECYRLQEIDKRIIIINQDNQGVSKARNVGKQNATGDYIIFIDADDELDCRMLEILYTQAKKTDSDISVCGVDRIFEKKQEEKKKYHCNYEEITVDQAIEWLLLGQKIESGAWNKLFKASTIEDVHFEEGKKINEDKYFVFRSLLKSKKIVYCAEKLYYYYCRENSVTNQSFSERWFDSLYFADRIYEELREMETR